MKQFPGHGTNESVHATFRLIPHGPSRSPIRSAKDAIGKQVMLEPFDLPGTAIVHQGKESNLKTVLAATAAQASVFHFVRGRDGHSETVSLESHSHKGCYIYSVSHKGVRLSCLQDSPATSFKQATSFDLHHGVSQYHPISFTTNGTERSYVLQPLHRLKDEFENVYFDIQS